MVKGIELFSGMKYFSVEIGCALKFSFLLYSSSSSFVFLPFSRSSCFLCSSSMNFLCASWAWKSFRSSERLSRLRWKGWKEVGVLEWGVKMNALCGVCSRALKLLWVLKFAASFSFCSLNFWVESWPRDSVWNLNSWGIVCFEISCEIERWPWWMELGTGLALNVGILNSSLYFDANLPSFETPLACVARLNSSRRIK